MKNANPARRFPRLFFGLYLIVAIALLALTRSLAVAQSTFCALLVTVIMALWIALRAYEKKRFSPSDTLSLLSIGLYDPEDERDESVKAQAGYVALTITLTLVYIALVVRWFVLAGSTLDMWTDPISLTLLIVGLTGQLTYYLALRTQT